MFIRDSCLHAQSLQSCPTLCNPMDYIACQASLSMEFSREEYGSRLPFFPLGIFLTQEDLPDLSPVMPAMAGEFLTNESEKPSWPVILFSCGILVCLWC